MNSFSRTLGITSIRVEYFAFSITVMRPLTEDETKLVFEKLAK